MITAFSDPGLLWLFGLVASLLVVASVVGFALKRSVKGGAQAAVSNMNQRIIAWWVMVAVLALVLAIGEGAVVFFFGLVSFLALREFITLTPTHRGDHRTLFWSFFVFTPLQYYFVWMKWYGLFSILIPVYAFLLIPLRSAMSGDTNCFFERAAKIQWALMVCAYCLSFAPALLALDIPGYQGQNAKLLFYFLLVVQLSDVLQYVWGKLLGKRRIAPNVSPNKTWEGFVGGVLTASLTGAALWKVTPFSPWQAAGISLAATLMGFAGGLTMSAIKRDRGVKDYGTMIAGHGGVLDRIDSLCFSAPVFFHITRYYFSLT